MEKCAICGCTLHREGEYAQPTIRGRSHATAHHFVPERFFGRSKNRPNEQREAILSESDLAEFEHDFGILCYECHEELLHNPVLLREDIELFSSLATAKGYAEEEKEQTRKNIAGRIELLHQVIRAGLKVFAEEAKPCQPE
ncbi:MAG: hypothetical protein GF399_12295 [Candidatus Coatesbacteria bacterium]|nr:hypothetical protein [Candidatus Coatesbacteria bacterium]